MEWVLGWLLFFAWENRNGIQEMCVRVCVIFMSP